jgi:subtilisin family serine protease
MIKRIQIFFLIFAFGSLHSQNQYFVWFKQKDIAKSTLSLSEASIERKVKYNVDIDEKDYAIDPIRIQELEKKTPVLLSSKWLNGALIEIDESKLKEIQSLDFVKKIELIARTKKLKSSSKKSKSSYTIAEYGSTFNQINIHKGDTLHSQGFNGEGMKIAVFDAGFQRIDSIASLKHLFDENRIFPIKNYVYNTDSFYKYDNHGTLVLGCMGSFLKDTIIGTAPKANYYLFITEASGYESKVEEINWAKAAEVADSIGVDIINSSLGYTEFDDASTNYSFEQLDGKTAISSIAAQIASDKGILVVNAAGNLGNKSWKKIACPADAEGVITVGAIDKDGNITDFSSRGYNALNQIKPNVCAVGKAATCYYDQGGYAISNGTSFASPIMAGLISCFWQANKMASPDKIKDALYRSSHRFTNPNEAFGYGIPNFATAQKMISKIDTSNAIQLYPNPTQDAVVMEFIHDATETIKIDLYCFQGLIMSQTEKLIQGNNLLRFDLSNYARGAYFFKLTFKDRILYKKLIKN